MLRRLRSCNVLTAFLPTSPVLSEASIPRMSSRYVLRGIRRALRLSADSFACSMQPEFETSSPGGCTSRVSTCWLTDMRRQVIIRDPFCTKAVACLSNHQAAPSMFKSKKCVCFSFAAKCRLHQCTPLPSLRLLGVNHISGPSVSAVTPLHELEENYIGRTHIGQYPWMDRFFICFRTSMRNTSTSSGDHPKARVNSAMLSPEAPFPRFSYVHIPEYSCQLAVSLSFELRIERGLS